jgi:hypothetical protein
MAVRCEGDSRVMEQLGEKQDFEAELSRQGLKHEDFVLHVRRGGLSLCQQGAFHVGRKRRLEFKRLIVTGLSGL